MPFAGRVGESDGAQMCVCVCVSLSPSLTPSPSPSPSPTPTPSLSRYRCSTQCVCLSVSVTHTLVSLQVQHAEHQAHKAKTVNPKPSTLNPFSTGAALNPNTFLYRCSTQSTTHTRPRL